MRGFTTILCLLLATVCAQAQLILRVSPESTLLAPGSTSVELTLDTARETSCRFSLQTAEMFEQMTPFAETGRTRHRSNITNLSANPSFVNSVFVRCAAQTQELRELKYRALARPNHPYPRVANLWGSRILLEKGIEHAARINVHMAAYFSIPELKRLRELNPNVIVLGTINAVEASDVPDDYYLKDIHGKKIEVWPGSFRVNLTKPHVVEYQAQLAYRLILDSGMLLDGCFFDNVMADQSWVRRDIFGNRIQIDADEDGREDDPRVLDAQWRKGLFDEIRRWRELMPHAYATGHLNRPPEPETLELFNGDSIGFLSPEVIEGKNPFRLLWDVYNNWFAKGRAPTLMMIESAPPTQISYGYGFFPLRAAPESTLEFARTYYPNMRFGLGVTLMNDGYFGHEYGDSFHGNDWWYDELDFALGDPQGPARRLDIHPPSNANLVSNGGYEAQGSWTFYSNAGAKASFRPVRSDKHEGLSSALLEIAASNADWHVSVNQGGLKIERGVTYELSFWARSDTPHPLTVALSKDAPDWRNYGLSENISISPSWKQYFFHFYARETTADARLQLMAGAKTGSVWIDDVRMTAATVPVYRRDFANGAVLLNPNASPQAVQMEPGFQRLNGKQAARHEFIVDDSPEEFLAQGMWEPVTFDSGFAKPAGPYFHSWGKISHRCGVSACAPAAWRIPISETDSYTVAVWWPNAPESVTWTNRAVFDLSIDGRIAASRNMDQSKGGDEWHELFRANIPANARVELLLRNGGTGAAIADAVWLRSAARYNDGSAAPVVTLAPFDSIILRKTAAAK